MDATVNCQSCAMPIEDGEYCQHCVDENGTLLTYEETFKRMVQFYLSQKRSKSREEAKREVLTHMAKMPAWRDHPQLQAALVARK